MTPSRQGESPPDAREVCDAGRRGCGVVVNVVVFGAFETVVFGLAVELVFVVVLLAFDPLFAAAFIVLAFDVPPV